ARRGHERREQVAGGRDHRVGGHQAADGRAEDEPEAERRADEAERVLALARDRYGRIDGIVHAAGVLRDSFARNKSAQDLDAVFAPKIRGALHLDRF
ncbi:KR domain-containing protein, partial [Salinisphaera sp. USBA-960]|nr:KR domain-containing protein [Salifodinibacter halophilus]